MSCPKYDFHIHTKHLGCANGTMEVADIVGQCTRLGLEAIGITDHLNSLDQLPLHETVKREIEALHPSIDVYFGVELNFTGCDQGFAFNEEVKDRYGFQFAIGGIHALYLKEYDLRTLIDIQHRHHLRTCEDPLVQVLVHPYWFDPKQFEQKGWPWFDSVALVPHSYALELGQVARETGTAIEINATANVWREHYSEKYVQEYVEYLRIIAAEGPLFSVSTDAHDIDRLRHITEAWRVVELLGLSEDRIWRPACAPFNGRR